MHKNKIIIMAIMVLLAKVAFSATINYEQYQEKTIFKGKPAKPNLATHKEARTYRTVIRERAKEGPNFAGQYTIIRIGCGTGCVYIAVVDARTGRVYFPQNLHHVFWAGWWHETYGLQFKLNSRLCVVYGQANSEDAPYGISYFEWVGGEFKLVHFEPKDRGRSPE
jgi:hypothetical protein